MGLNSPAGLAVTSDEALQAILEDLETWRASLPDELQFRGPESPRHAGEWFFTFLLALSSRGFIL